jgi:uncharacterized protein (DUF1800 family)
MTTREKVAHILRRYGLGASKSELDYYERLGVDGTLDRLINFEKVDEGFNIPIYTFARAQGDLLQLRPQQVAAWWILRMLVTQRPMQEKLTLFWHDHFAISGSKVNQGLLMYQYLETLRKNSNGNFMYLLRDTSKEPAMLQWLDNNTNVKGKPNENFAREVMELFTMGIGHYTETDIQEAARAFTGWSFARAGAARPTKEEVEDSVKNGQPLVQFMFRPRLHDDGMKKVLGNEGNFNGDDVIGILAPREDTARYITSKLWKFFAMDDLPQKLHDKLTRLYLDKGLELKPILFAIAESNEFYEPKCVRHMVKSPVDFVVGLGRQLGLGVLLTQQFDPDNTNALRQFGGALQVLFASMTNMGMQLLFPPDVAGWDWGPEWISSATMVERIKFAATLYSGRNAAAAQWVADSIKARKPKDSRDVVMDLLEIYDSKLGAAELKGIIEVCDQNGGIGCLEGGQKAQKALQAMSKLIFAAPDFHFC